MGNNIIYTLVVKLLIISLLISSTLFASEATENALLFDKKANETVSNSLEKKSQDAYPKFWEMFTNLPEDWVIWFKDSARVSQLPKIAAVAGMTVYTISTDYESLKAVRDWHARNSLNTHLGNNFADGGDGKLQFGLAALFAMHGYSYNSPKSWKVASQTVEVILATAGVVQLLKHTTGRESPTHASTRVGDWDVFPSQIKYNKNVAKYDAFPSGHIATTTATLMVFMENYPEAKWLEYLSYPLITSVGIGLMATNIHWLSDIPLGIALGYQFGKIVSHKENFRKKYANGFKPSFKPSVEFAILDNNRPGITLNWRF